MRKYHISHVRHHAQKHHDTHINLKKLLKLPIYTEKVWGIFATTFFATLISIIIFINWSAITNFFTPAPPAEIPQIHGFQSGILSTYRINKQTNKQREKYLAQIPSGNYIKGLITNQTIGNHKEKPVVVFSENTLKNSIWLTSTLSTGQHMTKMNNKKALGLQKGIITTFYLGEKTVNINSTIQNDTKLISQINNTLSVNLFQYLNQSDNRADSLDNYLNLLNTLLKKANSRIKDLNSKINFLQSNSSAQEAQIKFSEEAFFENLKSLNGPDAEENLAKFIGVRENQVEVKAKIGAYTGLKDYYVFFKPKLENLIKAIRANRDPLIAGVKVVEIENMTLPLIIKEN